ncbi:response regulator [Bdellovibrio sp. 22V]|uniref:response regulator n=1 Tax=Bdellovibrio sp. 22V TaxID=3044166 RepID=UPI0025436C98|nr:response regulator [Bdellovibrio sp. 22V]WII72948.1 response regulator [Bdellovibrio sp. 22V]
MVIEKPLTVVIVDDESSVGFLSRMKFRNAIQNGTVDLHFFENAAETMKYLESRRKDMDDIIVFTDINMPEVSGYELLEDIREKFPQLPVYMMSAYDDSTSISKSFNLGAQGYFTKPVNYKDVKSLIETKYGVTL